MSYTKTTWRNNQAPAINADNLNHMEQGIESAHNQIDVNTSNIESLTTQVQNNATNIASEISARQTTDSSLQSQIDQLVAPTGEAPTPAEIENARIGDDGVTYDTLGNAIRGQFSDVKSSLNNGFELINNKNFANPNDPNYLAGAYLDTSGVEHATIYYNATGFIPVKEGDVLISSYNNNGTRTAIKMRFMTAYDSSKTVMPSAGAGSEGFSYTIPSGVSFVRISVGAVYWVDLQIEKSNVITSYVAPNALLNPRYIPSGFIKPNMMAGFVVSDGYNITPLGESGNGGWYVSGSSLVYSNSGGFANFGYYICPIDENSKYSFSGIGRFVITVDASGNIVDNSGNTTIRSFNVSANAVKMYFTYDKTAFPDGVAICKGDVTTDETEYALNWLVPNFPKKSIKGKSIDNRVYCSIPNTIYMNTSESIKIYLDDILAQKGSYFWCNSVSGLTTYIDEEYLQITCATAGSYSLKWAVYDSNLQKIDEGTSTVKVSALSALASKKALVLGDSFVAWGDLSEALRNIFSEQDKTLTLIGTRGTAPNLHEGRGGWSADAYCNYASMGQFTNPFYHNDTFDFAYYMSQNGYSDLDYVFINLGINKVFGQDFATYSDPSNIPYDLECYMDIIESIHSYDANIKIFCNLPTPPNTQDGKFSQAYGTQQMLWLYANNIKHYAKDMIDNISGTNVYIVGTNFVFDTNTDISDGVHPTSAGYPILAKAMVNAVIGA